MSYAEFMAVASLLIGFPVVIGLAIWAFRLDRKERVTFTLVVALMVLGMATLPSLARGVETYAVGFQGVSIELPTGAYIWDNNSRSTVPYDGLEIAYNMSTLTAGRLFDFSVENHHGTLNPGASTIEYYTDSSLGAVADSYVDQNLPANNYGSLTTMDVESLTSVNRRVFVRWDVSSIPSDATVVDAQMALRKTATIGTFPRTYHAQRAVSPFIEGTLTWNNQPGVTGPIHAATVTAVTGIFGVFTWDVTSTVQDWVDGTASNYGFRLRDSVEGSGAQIRSTFSSREGTSIPNLSVNYSRVYPLDDVIDSVTSVYGQARDFDGYDDYVETSTDFSNDEFSVVMAVNARALDSADDLSTLVAKEGEWNLSVRADGTITFQAWDLDNSLFGLNSTSTMSVGSPQIVGLTWDGFNMGLWLDGSQVGAANHSRGIRDQGATIRIGGETSYPNRYWDGQVDEFAAYSVAKSGDEMIWSTTPGYEVTLGQPPVGDPIGEAVWQAIVGWGAVAVIFLFIGVIVWGAFSNLRGMWRR